MLFDQVVFAASEQRCTGSMYTSLILQSDLSFQVGILTVQLVYFVQARLHSSRFHIRIGLQLNHVTVHSARL